MRSCDVDIEGLHRGPHPAYHFACPERRAKERYPPVFWVAYSAEDIALIGWLVGVHAAPGKFAFERGIRSLRSGSRAYSEGFSLEALEKLEQLNLPRLRQYQAAPTSFSKLKPSQLAKLPNAIDVAKKIDNIEIISSQGREERGPNLGGLLTSNRLAVFRFDQFEAHRLYTRAEVKRFHVQ